MENTETTREGEKNARREITQLKRYSNAAGTNLIGSTAWGYNVQGDITSITHVNAFHQTIQDETGTSEINLSNVRITSDVPVPPCGAHS